MRDVGHRRWIEVHLREQRVTFDDIAKELGIHRLEVQAVCERRYRSESIELAVAAKLRLPPDILWSGLPLPPAIQTVAHDISHGRPKRKRPSPRRRRKSEKPTSATSSAPTDQERDFPAAPALSAVTPIVSSSNTAPEDGRPVKVDIENHDSIKRRLRARKITFQKIAKDLGITQPAVTRVCQGHARSVRVEVAIANALEVPVATLWPGRY